MGRVGGSRRLSLLLIVESALADRVSNGIGIVSGLVLAMCLCLNASAASAGNPGPFRWLVPSPAPAGWKHVGIPSGGAVLWYPPSLSPIHGDRPSVSVAKRDKSGRVLVYLNSTPQQGAENLANWPQFRIEHDQAESTAVHRDAAGVALSFRNAVGSCVIDHYITRYHANHYHEIACFVQGPTTASVVVGAALESEWTRAAPLLKRAISAYQAR
jgi:hypothetical protein